MPATHSLVFARMNSSALRYPASPLRTSCDRSSSSDRAAETREQHQTTNTLTHCYLILDSISVETQLALPVTLSFHCLFILDRLSVDSDGFVVWCSKNKHQGTHTWGSTRCDVRKNENIKAHTHVGSAQKTKSNANKGENYLLQPST